MDIFVMIIMIMVGLLAAFTVVFMFLGSIGYFDDDRWWEMTVEEEFEWLTKEQGLTDEEAWDIIEIPHRRIEK